MNLYDVIYLSFCVTKWKSATLVVNNVLRIIRNVSKILDKYKDPWRNAILAKLQDFAALPSAALLKLHSVTGVFL